MSDEHADTQADDRDTAPPGAGEGGRGGHGGSEKGAFWRKRWVRRSLGVLVVLVILAIPLGIYGWYKLFREVPQPAWITSDPATNFLYGSIGTERDGGIPYWIVVTLPRIFDDLLPGPGGYASLGLPWEEGKELPAGFSKKTVGFERVGFNCALCHATRYRTHPDSTPKVVAAGGSHTADIQGLLEFFSRAANDERFGAETILPQIDVAYPLGFIDRLLYKFVYIPAARKALARQGAEFAWAQDRPRWGPGRDAPMNLTKFNFLGLPLDETIDNTDFPAIWSLSGRVQEGRVWPEDDHSLTADWSHEDVPPPERLMLMNLDGATTSFRSVIIDSGLGLQARNNDFFRRRVAEIEEWLMELEPPDFPFPIDEELAAAGQPLFAAHCAECHRSGRDNRLGTVIPLEEIGTDAHRTAAWTRQAADSANRVVRGIGIRRTPMGKPDPQGYIAVHLDGLWLRAPYLHNGSVPTLRALLEPPEARPDSFYRGYDVIDPRNVGYISRRCAGERAELPPGSESVGFQWGCMPSHEGWLYETRLPGNDNGGHDYGVDLTAAEKAALVEYLKRL